MQDIDEDCIYDLVVSLSWCVHYCSDEKEIFNVLRAMRRSLRPSGRLLLQIAHSANLPTQWMEDIEPGPDGIINDVSLKYRFRADPLRRGRTHAEYKYSCRSRGEAFSETHILEVTDAFALRRAAIRAGFERVELWNNFKRDPFTTSGSVFLTGRKPD
jgi:SAM-dependent methyltransferase